VTLAVAIDTWSQAKRKVAAEPTAPLTATEALEPVAPLEPDAEPLDPNYSDWNWKEAQDLESANPWENR
jgi:hypothetical protein